MTPPPHKKKPGNGIEENKTYPEPLAAQNDIVLNSTVFWDTLRRFHFIMGTKFMVPVIGGKELDLHVLYVEATKRGGYEKVVMEKRWREVGSVFNFSPTTTSASFVLRKHYFSLLYHYEQVHFFKIKGTPQNPDAFSVHESSPGNELAMVEYSSPKRVTESPDPVIQGSSSFTAEGTIEGKIDCGYLVSVKLGEKVLNGVLYHLDKSGPSASLPPQISTAIVPYETGHIDHHPRKRRRRRRSRRANDPSYPKANRSGYNFFFAEKHYKLKSQFPNREREFTKMIGQAWNQLSVEERMVYQNIGLQDKERYKRELKEYKERLKMGQNGQNVEVEGPK